MKKLLNFTLLLFLSVSLFGQVVINPHISATVESTPSGNMIDHGDFADITQDVSTDGTYWFTGTSWTIGSGVATYDNINNGSAVAQSAAKMVSPVQINTSYDLYIDVIIASGTATIRIENSDGSVQYLANASYSNGTHQLLQFTTPADIGTGGIRVRAGNSSSNPFSIDNLDLQPTP